MKPNSFHLSELLLDGVYEWMRSAELKQTGKRPIPADDTSISTHGARSIIKRELQGKKPSWWNYLLASTQDKHVFYEALRVIARLSAVDGAVIVSPEFRVLGFGATLQPRNSERVESVNIVEMKGDVPPRVEKPITAFRGGTRHQSAAQFAMDQPESVVFVVSQDGVVSLMTDGPNKQQVSVYRHLEYM